MTHAVNWFEIPVADFERAKAFYNQIVEGEMYEVDAGDGRQLAVFPGGDDGVRGSILQVKDFNPSKAGSIVYLNADSGIDAALERVQAAGGKVDTPKFEIGHGYLATFIDSEGNTVGLLQWGKEK